MKVIEDNWGSFPRVETCTKCNSKVRLDSREESASIGLIRVAS